MSVQLGDGVSARKGTLSRARELERLLRGVPGEAKGLHEAKDLETVYAWFSDEGIPAESKV